MPDTKAKCPRCGASSLVSPSVVGKMKVCIACGEHFVVKTKKRHPTNWFRSLWNLCRDRLSSHESTK